MKKLIPVLIVLVFISSNLYSQTNIISSKFTKPFFSIDADFGYALPMFDLAGSSVKEFYDLKSYSTQNGYSGDLKFGFTIANYKWTQLRLKLTIGYARFLGSDNVAYNYGMVKIGWPTPPEYKTPVPTSGTSSISIHQPYTAVGMDYVVFTDSKRTSLFNFGGDIVLTGAFGKVYDQPSGMAEDYNNILSAVRFGFGINTVYTYRPVEWMGLNTGVRFEFTNLLGKTSASVSEGRDIPFNDDGNYAVNPNLNSRNTGHFTFFGGVSFYMGGKK
ncbi:MAG: hypothetical protein LWX07_05575 [Bacteroidetes bacterium]|nr:hypothetical protein [Bacteroidota bacterium]